MVGHLSRHINRSTSTEESGYYAKRNEKFLKLHEVNCQTILINNRTQGAVEQHFGDIKHNYFNNGRLDRLDDFVYDYHSSIILQEKQFAKFYLNTKKQKRKHSKSTNIKHELSPKKKTNIEVDGIQISQTQRPKFLFVAVVYKKIEF